MQIWPWNVEWSRAKTNRVLPRKCTGHSQHPLPTTQEKTLHMDITRWSTLKSDWLYILVQPKMEKLYTVSKNKTGSWLWLRSAAAAAASLQSCPTLCNPIDSKPPPPLSLGFSRQEYQSGLPFTSPMHESEKWKWSHSVVSYPQWPHGLQPTRLLRPCDFPGKSTGVGWYCLLRNIVYVCTSKMVGVARGHQRADTLKPYSQKTSQSNHTRTTAFSNSMKLSHAVWDGSWWRGLTECGSLEKGMANNFSILALRTPWTVWKGKIIGYWKRNSPRQKVPNTLLEINGEITQERMKGWSQSKNNTQLWMWLVIEARSHAVKSNIA